MTAKGGAGDEFGILYHADASSRQGLAAVAERRPRSLPAGRRVGVYRAYVGEHTTDKAENITSCIAFIAWIAAATKRIRLGTGTINMPNTHPAALAASLAMLDHMLDGR